MMARIVTRTLYAQTAKAYGISLTMTLIGSTIVLHAAHEWMVKNMQVKIGDTIGLINKVKFNMRDNRENYWDLTEGKVKSITINSKGRRVKTEHYYTMDAEEIENNTQWMLESNRLILTGEQFILTDELRERVERWIDKENALEAQDG